MAGKSKSGKGHGTARRLAALPPVKRGRGAVPGSDAWEQTAQMPDERHDQIDCQRIVQGDSDRTLPLFYDDYN